MAEGAQWGGQPIKLETEFIITQRDRAVARACRRIAEGCRARAGLSHRSGRLFRLQRNVVAPFRCSRRRPCRSSRASSTGLRPTTARSRSTCSPSSPARRKEAAHRRRRRDCVPRSAASGEGGRPSVHVGNDGHRPRRACAFGRGGHSAALVFVIAGGAGRNHHRQYRRLCAAAGTSLANIVRVLQFHTDIREFYPVYKVWERHLRGRPLPFSAVEVPSPLPVPGATVMIEAWAYAP